VTLQSEVEQIRKGGAGAMLPLAIALALAFAVGIAVKEIFDSRSAGALAWIVVLTSFAAFSLLRSLPKRPELITPTIVSVGAGWLTSSVIAIAAGAPALAPVFVLLGAVSLLYAWRRTRDRR
jgi:hypothetical protein